MSGLVLAPKLEPVKHPGLCLSYSRVSGFIEGASLVLRVWALVCWGHLQVAGDVDLWKGRGRAGDLSLGTAWLRVGVGDGHSIRPYQVPVVPRKPEDIDPEPQHILPWPGCDERRASIIHSPIH